MKKFPAIIIAAMLAASCNNSTSTTDTTDTIATTDPTMPVITTDADTTVAYVPADGDVIYRDEKVYVRENGNWAEAKRDITLDNGEVVYYKTHTIKKDGKTIELKANETVSKTGRFFDRTGQAIANAWDDTKDAVSDAGKAVGKTAKKVGKEIDTAVTGKKRD